MPDTAVTMNEAPKLDLVSRVRAALPLAVGLVLVLVVYSRTLDAPFLWDDERLLESPKVEQLDWPWNYLSVPFYPVNERQSLFYRPAVTFSLALDRAIHGGNASGFHLTNLFLHLTAVTLVYVLARRRYGATRPSAAAAATLFGLVPRLTESVAWIAGRTDVICTVFILFAWLAYQRGDFRRILLATAFAFLAMLAKESGIAVVVAIVLVELWPWPSKAALKRLAPLFGLTVLYLLIRAETLGHAQSGFPLAPLERLWTFLEAVGRYAFMALNPWQPRTQIGLVKHPSFGFVAFGVSVLAGGLVFLLRTRKRWTKELFFGGMVALVPIALVLNIIPLPWLVVAADRLLYTPLAALAVLLASGLDRLARDGRPLPGFIRAQRTLAVAVLALTASFAVVTYRCTALYLDSVEFWVNAVETTPQENFLPTTDLAAEFTKAGLYQEALALIDSVERRPDVTGVQLRSNYARASTLATMGRYAEAQELVARSPESTAPSLRTARAYLLANFGRIREARKLARDVLEDYPNLGSASRLLGHLERFDEERKKLAEPATPPLERATLRARMEMRLGRRAEASAAWLSLLSDPTAPRSVVDEAMTFLISFASFDNLKQAARVYRARNDTSPVLMVSLEDREAYAARLLEARPRIERALGVQFPR